MSKPRNKKYNPRKHMTHKAYNTLDRLRHGGPADDERFSTVDPYDDFSMPILRFAERIKNGHDIGITANDNAECDIVCLKKLYIMSYMIATLSVNESTDNVLTDVIWLRKWLDSIFSKMLNYVSFDNLPEGYDYTIDTAFTFSPLSTTGARIEMILKDFLHKISKMATYEYANLKYQAMLNLETWCKMKEIDKPFKKLIKVDIFREHLEKVLLTEGYLE